jgi:4a-hydroxytetrahydrobiopterin dehydratase
VVSWTELPSKLTKRFEFENYKQVVGFVNQLTELADELNHHPDITFGWGYAEVSTYSHDQKTVTELDREFAQRTNELYN